MKYILISLLILFPITLSDTTSHACSSKKIINSDGHLSNSPNGDLTLAYNKVGSCISLQTDSDDEVCCYIKIRFKNELLDERFTHKGCQPVQTKYLLEDADPDIDDYIECNNLMEYTSYDLCRGHDVIGLLEFVYGSTCSKSEMEEKMKTDYDKADFYRTALFANINNYCATFSIDAHA